MRGIGKRGNTDEGVRGGEVANVRRVAPRDEIEWRRAAGPPRFAGILKFAKIVWGRRGEAFGRWSASDGSKGVANEEMETDEMRERITRETEREGFAALGEEERFARLHGHAGKDDVETGGEEAFFGVVVVAHAGAAANEDNAGVSGVGRFKRSAELGGIVGQFRVADEGGALICEKRGDHGRIGVSDFSESRSAGGFDDFAPGGDVEDRDGFGDERVGFAD